MSNVTPFSGNLPTAADLKAGLARAANEGPATNALPFLRMIDGQWVYGPEDVEIEGRVAVHPGTFAHGYCSWERDEDKPAALLGEFMRPVAEKLPPASEMDATGSSWNEQVAFQAAIVDGPDAGTQLLYKTSSLGGRRAFAELASAIVSQLDVDASKIVPVCALKSDSYKHKKWGKTYTPIFDVVEWTTLEDAVESETAAEASTESQEASTPARRRRRRRSS